MELQVKDVVLIEVKNSLKHDTRLETIIGKCSDTKECLTQSFGIFKELDVKPLSSYSGGTCKLLKAWRLDPETDNYIRIYPVDYVHVYPEPKKEKLKEQRLFVTNNKKHELTVHDLDKPAYETEPEITTERYIKVAYENLELKEIVVDQAKEIHNLKKGN